MRLFYERQSSDEKRREALHEKFRKLLIKGKARFNMLRAALSRKEALATFQRLVNEDGELSSSKSTKTPRRKPSCRRVAHDTPDETNEGVKQVAAEAAAEPDASSTGETLTTTTKQASETSQKETAPRRQERAGTVDERLRFRSQGSSSPGQPGNVVSIHFSQSCFVRGSCLVSSRAVAYNERVSAWRFLDPGISAVRLEFRILEREGVVLTLNEFVTPPEKQAFVDIRLDGHIIANSRSQEDFGNSIQLEPLDDSRHLLEIALCSHESAAWAYHLQSITISRPPPFTRDPPSTDEIPQLLASLPNIHVRHEIQQHNHDALVASYKQGFREHLLEKRQA